MYSRLCLAKIQEDRREPVEQCVPRQEPENEALRITTKQRRASLPRLRRPAAMSSISRFLPP